MNKRCRRFQELDINLDIILDINLDIILDINLDIILEQKQPDILIWFGFFV